jgi:hypothetical protein
MYFGMKNYFKSNRNYTVKHKAFGNNKFIYLFVVLYKIIRIHTQRFNSPLPIAS